MKTKAILFVCLLQTACCHLSLKAQTWNTVGDSTQILNYDSITPGGEVFVIKQIDSLLYVGGGFLYAGNIRVNSIATWDGTKWDSIGNGMGQYGVDYDICKFNNEIYCGSLGFGKWNGVSWSAVGTGFTADEVNALEEYNGQLYIGGSGIKINGTDQHNILRWNGTYYMGTKGGVLGSPVKALTIYNNELIVGGEFDYAGTQAAYNIAAWDGNDWDLLGLGLGGYAYSMVVDTINNFLYVGGGFTQAGGISGIPTPSGIARWDGFQWDSLCNSVIMCPYAMKFYHNKLFVAGGFYGQYAVTPQGDTLNSIAYWDNNKWNPLGKGLIEMATATALGVYNDELYVGGYGKLLAVNHNTAWGIARYYEPPDTVSCTFIQPLIHAMPFGTKKASDTIYTTSPYNIQFYTNNKYASSWNWDFGDGNSANMREPAHTYAAPGTYNVMLEVIHPHNLSSKVCTLNVSKTITIIDNTAIKEIKLQEVAYLGQNIPNPFTNTTAIPYNVPAGSKGVIQIADSKGDLINEYPLQQGKNQLKISMANYKAGVYFYSMVIDGVVKETRKMVVE